MWAAWSLFRNRISSVSWSVIGQFPTKLCSYSLELPQAHHFIWPGSGLSWEILVLKASASTWPLASIIQWEVVVCTHDQLEAKWLSLIQRWQYGMYHEVILKSYFYKPIFFRIYPLILIYHMAWNHQKVLQP